MTGVLKPAWPEGRLTHLSVTGILPDSCEVLARMEASRVDRSGIRRTRAQRAPLMG
jgi:hypothetical protein